MVGDLDQSARGSRLLHGWKATGSAGFAGECEEEVDTFCQGIEPGEGRLADCVSKQVEGQELGNAEGAQPGAQILGARPPKYAGLGWTGLREYAAGCMLPCQLLVEVPPRPVQTTTSQP
jgi:hypothetical protein